MKKIPSMLLLLIMSCSPPEFLSPEELTAYVLKDENGLHKLAEANGTKAEVTYRPTDLWVHQESNTVGSDTAAVNALRKKYSPNYYFILSLSRNNKEALHQADGFGQYSDLVQTLSFRMPQYVNLTTSEKDTIPVSDFLMNRTFGMAGATDILFVFDKEKTKDKEWVQFNLNEFGLNMGNQRFRFNTKDLDEAPGIRF